jgi:hypothetical protein
VSLIWNAEHKSSLPIDHQYDVLAEQAERITEAEPLPVCRGGQLWAGLVLFVLVFITAWLYWAEYIREATQ